LPGRAAWRPGLIRETGPVAERVRVREIDDDKEKRLVRIVRRGTGSAVTWRRAQMVLLSAQGMDVAGIARVAFTSEDHVRDVIHNFNADGFDSLYPRYRGGHPPKFTLPQRREIKKIAKSSPAEHSLPFSTWSLSKLAEFLVAEGWSTTSATRGSGFAPRGRRHVSTPEDLEGLYRPQVHAEEGPDRAALRDRRRRGATARGCATDRHLRRRVRAAQSAAATWSAVGRDQRQRARIPGASHVRGCG
jgi:transposase